MSSVTVALVSEDVGYAGRGREGLDGLLEKRLQVLKRVSRAYRAKLSPTRTAREVADGKRRGLCMEVVRAIYGAAPVPDSILLRNIFSVANYYRAMVLLG